MKFIYLWLLLISLGLNTYAQTLSGSISGKSGEPAVNISVRLDSTMTGTTTDVHGDFILRHIKAGNYTLIASGIGYAPSKIGVVVAEKNNVFLNLKLDPSISTLQEVTVTSYYKHPKDRASAIAARLPLANFENPQVVNIVTPRLIIEQGSTDFSSIIRNLPGVTKQWSSVSPFYSSRGFNTRNYIRNGLTGYSASEPDPVNIELMQAVKGPSGTLFGSSLVSFGGLLNRITKQPFDTTHIEISYQGGSYELSRFTADVNTPLNIDKTVLLRISAARHYEGSFQDAGFVRSTFIAPSLVYKLNDRLSLSFEAEFFAREGTSLPQITPAGPIQSGSKATGASLTSQLPLDYRRSYGNNSITLKDPNQSFYGQVSYRLSDYWTSQTNLVRSQFKNTGNYLTVNLLKGDSTLVRNISNYLTSQSTITQIQQNFTGDFKVGRMRNRLVAGFDYYQSIGASSTNSLNGRGGRRAFDTLDIRHAMPNYEALNPEAINNKLTGLLPTYTSSLQNSYALYASDVLDLTEALSAMLSLRIDRFENGCSTNLATGVTAGKYGQTAWSPKFGLVYQLIKSRLSLFGNYTNGFQNVAPVTQPDGLVSTFKPQYGDQLEAGLKTELAGEILSATISYYNIRISNTLRANIDRPNYTVQEGAQFSKGVEIDFFAQPLSGFLVNAGFTYNNSKLTSADGSVNGLRPTNSGAPKSANWYTSYTIPSGSFKGLGAGFGGNYTDRVIIINNTTNGQFATDAYTLLNGSLFYNRPGYRIGMNLDNLTNRRYYYGGFGTVTPGVLRRFMLNLTIKF